MNNRKSKWTKRKVVERIKELHKELRRRPKRDDSPNLYQVSRKLFGNWNNAMEESGYNVKRNQKPRVPNKLTPELFYFTGLLITDGHLVEDLKRRHYILLLFTSYEEEKDLILNLIRKLFSYESYVRKRKTEVGSRINYEIHINSKELLYYFKNQIGLPTGQKSKSVRVPKIIFSVNRNNLVNFLRGVMDGDGNISLNKPLSISSGSIKFLKDLKGLFSRLNFKTSNIFWNGSCYCLPLFQRDNNGINGCFYENANLFYPRKKQMLESNTFKNRNYY